ncbi:MAG TPA: efflux RND transporter periplasmic adaptor subunit [Pseudomonadales bacterium]
MSFRKWAVTIVGCLVVFGALAAYKVNEIRGQIAMAEAYPEQSETVEEARVSTADFTPTISVIGEVLAPQRLDLRNEIGGEITSVNFRSGDRVEQGQLLVQLDTKVQQANLEAARARAELAQTVHERNERLLDTRVVNQDTVDRSLAELTAARAEIEVLQRTIEQLTLRAPFSGRAGLHNFEVGQILQAGTLITTLIGDTADMWIDFQMPQFYPQLGIGDTVSVATISNDAGAARTDATIIAENTILNADNRSRGYRASVPNDAARFAPSTVVQLDVPIGAPEELLQVPAIAVQNDPLGQYVFVLREDGAAFRAVRQQVRVRLVDSERALLEPDADLTEGTRVAAAGAFKLYEGILVHVRERNRAAAERAAEPSAVEVQ